MSTSAAAALEADRRVGEPVTVGTKKAVRLVRAAEGQGAGPGPSGAGSRIGPAGPEQSLSGSGRDRWVRSWPFLVLALAGIQIHQFWMFSALVTGLFFGQAAGQWRPSWFARSAASAVSRGFSTRVTPSLGGSLWWVVV